VSDGPPASTDRAGNGRAETGLARGGLAGAGQARTGPGGERPGRPRPGRPNRRRALGAGLGGLAAVAVAGAAAIELAARGVLPGRQLVDWLDGACSVASPPLVFSAPGLSVSGTFRSRARRREVRYVIAWPPGYRPGAPLPLIVVLHPFGAAHLSALTGMSPPQALALQVDGRPLPPMAMAAADGGPGCWNPHPGDDPMAMVIDELIPLCQRHGLGRRAIGTFGISMGGYGALLLAEKHPGLISAVAAIGPAIWTSYGQARAVNPGAYSSAAAFTAADAVTHAHALAGVAVRVACGLGDPFYPGVRALTRVLPPGAVTDLSQGCHSYPFFVAQEPPSLAFLGRHLTR
jgi:pimeloyl-ACP methyl ester carboxylesterase